jgi:AcrR family transcriptional regulator
VTGISWDPRRLTAVAVALPDGAVPAGTRSRILHSALRLFAEFGYAGTSIRDIADGAEVNSATLYTHYASKERILAELVLLGHRELQQRLQQALVQADPGPVAQLSALVRTHAYAHTDFPLLALVANSELHALSPEQAAPALMLREQSRELLLQVLAHGVARGVFDIDDIGLTAIALGSMGIRIANWFGPDQPYTRDQVADAQAGFALRIVGAAATTVVSTTRPAGKERR